MILVVTASELLGWLGDRTCRPLIAADSLASLEFLNDSRLLNAAITFFPSKQDLHLRREYCQSKHAIESSPYQPVLLSRQLELQVLL